MEYLFVCLSILLSSPISYKKTRKKMKKKYNVQNDISIPSKESKKDTKQMYIKIDISQ